MKKLSDYQGEAAIELWADLLEPLIDIFSDTEVQNIVKEHGSVLHKAQTILKNHKSDAVKILTAIDPSPITGLNLITRLVGILLEIENSEEFADFFGSSSQGITEGEFSGSATGSTGEEEK